MMLEARVRPVDAIEWTVWVDDRWSRRAANDFSASMAAGSCSSSHGSIASGCRIVLMQHLQTRYVTRPMTAMPPMTPPAMAPTLGPELPLLPVLPPVEAAGCCDGVMGPGPQKLLGRSEQLVGAVNWQTDGAWQ